MAPYEQKEEIRRLREELERCEKERTALTKGAKAVLEPKGFAEKARAIFDHCKELIGAASGYVALLSGDGAENELLFLESGGRPCSVNPDLPMPIRGLRAEAYKTNRAVYDNDFMKSRWLQYLPKGHLGLNNVLFAPLVLEEKTVGIIGLANKSSDFTEEDAAIAERFGQLAAIALQNARTEDKRRIVEAEKEKIIYALRESEERYRSLFHNNHAVMLLIDPSTGDIVDANPAACIYYGHSRKEIKRLHISDINTLSSAQVDLEMKSAKSMKKRHFSFRHRMADGRLRDVDVFSGPIIVQGRQLLYSIVHDVTERKRVEQERENLIAELQTALAKVETLSGLLPICAACKKIRDDQGYWNQIESYVSKHSKAEFSHSICPECARQYYPDIEIYDN